MADEDDPKLGDIHVSMRDQNTIGHIGHIVYHRPPPSPNAIRQHRAVAGELGGAPTRVEPNSYYIPKLFVEPDFDYTQEFMVQGLRLKITGGFGMAEVSIAGRPPVRTLSDLTCEVLGPAGA